MPEPRDVDRRGVEPGPGVRTVAGDPWAEQAPALDVVGVAPGLIPPVMQPATLGLLPVTTASEKAYGDSEPTRAADIESVATSVLLAQVILRDGLKQARRQIGTGGIVAIHVALHEPLDDVVTHLAQAVDVAQGIDPSALQKQERAAIIRALDQFHAELEHYGATAIEEAALYLDGAPGDDQLAVVEANLRGRLGLPDAGRTARRPAGAHADVVQRSVAATAAQVEGLGHAIATCPDRELGDRLPLVIDRLYYAVQTIGVLPATERSELAPVVQQVGRTIDKICARAAASGMNESLHVWLAYSALCTIAGLDVPRIPEVAVDTASKDAADRAHKAIRAFETKGEDLVDGERAWLTNNWIEFLKYTSQNPRLSWSAGAFDSVITNVIGNFLTTVGDRLIKKGSAAAAGALVGSSIAPGVGAVVGFIVGVLIETVAGELYSLLTGGASDQDAAAAKAAKQAGELIQHQHLVFADNAEAARGEVRATAEVMACKVDDATTDRDVLDVETWAIDEAAATTEPVPATNLELADAMLRDWVLEHAGDEEGSASDTSEAQWDDAKRRVGIHGDVTNRADMFVHQSRYHLARMGFVESQIDAATEQMQADVVPGDADRTQASADARTFVFTGPADPAAFLAMFEGHSVFTVNDDGKAGVEAKQLVATMTLDLAFADGTVYVDEWEYTLEFADGRYGFVFHHKKPPRKDSVPLFVSPD